MERVDVLGVIGVGAIVAASVLAVVVCRADGADVPRRDSLAIVYDTPSDGASAIEQADGPLYDAPLDVEQSVVCDRDNRMYILIRTKEGGVAITPYLGPDGVQRVMPRP